MVCDRLIARRRNRRQAVRRESGRSRAGHPSPVRPAALWTAISAATRPRRTSFRQRSAAISQRLQGTVAPTNTGYDVKRKVPGPRPPPARSAGSRGGVLKRRIRADQILQPTGEIAQPHCVRRQRHAGDKVFELRRQALRSCSIGCGTVFSPWLGMCRGFGLGQRKRRAPLVQAANHDVLASQRVKRFRVHAPGRRPSGAMPVKVG